MGWFDDLKSKLGITSAQATAQSAANSVSLPDAVPPGVAPEASGTTVTGGKKVGGRRHRKTMKGGKKSRKTYRRKH